MGILEFMKENNSLAIYGTGHKGQELKELFDLGKIETKCFFVSKFTNGMSDSIDGIDVFEFEDWIKQNKSSDNIYAVCVAVSETYAKEIIPVLKQYNILFYYVKNEDYQSLHRKFNPVFAENFLLSVEPVSTLFGFDRGLPIDRWYIEYFLIKNAEGLKGVTRTLEVGEDSYSRRFFTGANITRDILLYENGMDLTRWETLPESAYDVFIATQVFNFIYDVRKAIGGAWHLLKEGGTLLATVAGNITQVSWADMNDYGDYWRFTDLSIKRLIQEVFGPSVEVETFGNAATATAFIQGLAVEDLPDKEILVEKDRGYNICIGIVATKKQEYSTGG